MRQYNIFGTPLSFAFDGFVSDMEILKKSNATFLRIEGARSTRDLYLISPLLHSVLPERNDHYDLVKEHVMFTQIYSNIDGIKRVYQTVERVDRIGFPLETLSSIGTSKSHFVETVRAAEKELRTLKL